MRPRPVGPRRGLSEVGHGSRRYSCAAPEGRAGACRRTLRRGCTVTHAELDRLEQDANTAYARQLLVTAGILPHRQETLAQLELWIAATVSRLPADQARIIRPFAEWDILKDARARARRGPYTRGAATADRDAVRTACMFLDWLDNDEANIESVTQEHLERWLDTHPTRRNQIGCLLRWTVARGITGTLEIPKRLNHQPSRFLEEQEYRRQLGRCLNDDTLPLDMRVIGALTRLYAIPITRILEMTTDRYTREHARGYLTIGANPVLLPPKLAHLIEALIERRGAASTFHAGPAQPPYLFPGRPPSRPRSVAAVQIHLNKIGLPNIHARNTAMLEAITELPAPVVSELFGLHPSTAEKWTRLAQSNWADYLAVIRRQE